jgi:hypothetical protein
MMNAATLSMLRDMGLFDAHYSHRAFVRNVPGLAVIQ